MSTEFGRTERLFAEKIDYVTEQIRLGKITLWTDLDGTRVRTSQRAISIFNKQNKTSYTEKDLIGTWDLVRWAEKLNIPNARDYAINLWNSYDVMRWSPPVSGAVELARFLYAHRKSKIIIPGVTARPSDTRHATYGWHEQWMPWLKDDLKKSLIMQSNGSVNPAFKIDALSVLKPDYYLEDQIHDAEGIASASSTTKVILVHQPWNENYVVPAEFTGRIIKTHTEPGQSKVLRAFQEIVEDAVR